MSEGKPTVGLVIADARMDVVTADRIFLDVFGFKEEEIVGKPLERLLGDDMRLHVDLLAALLFNARVLDDEVVAKLPNDETSHRLLVSAAAVRLEGPEKEGLFVTVQDVGPVPAHSPVRHEPVTARAHG